MVTTDRISAIFADARAVHADALRLLEASDIRDAAEKTWCATKRTTDALILARTGEEPEISSDTARGLVRLATEDRVFRALRRRYHSRQSTLHGDCFTSDSASLLARWRDVSTAPPTTSTTPSGWPAIPMVPDQKEHHP